MSAIHIDAAVYAGDEHATVDKYLRRVWEPMMDKQSERFTGTTWEFMTAEGKPYKGDFCSYAQLFSPGPTWLLSAHVLGVTPSKPGFEEYRIWPRLRLTGVNWARGRVPTPTRSISVAWEESNEGWRFSLKAPRGLEGTVIIPDEVWERKKAILIGEGIITNKQKLPVASDGTLEISVIF